MVINLILWVFFLVNVAYNHAMENQNLDSRNGNSSLWKSDIPFGVKSAPIEIPHSSRSRNDVDERSKSIRCALKKIFVLNEFQGFFENCFENFKRSPHFFDDGQSEIEEIEDNFIQWYKMHEKRKEKSLVTVRDKLSTNKDLYSPSSIKIPIKESKSIEQTSLEWSLSPHLFIQSTSIRKSMIKLHSDSNQQKSKTEK